VIALLGSGALVATLGFIDDRGHVSARSRLLGHATAAAWVLGWIGALPPMPMFGATVDLGVAATLLAGLYIVWSINLFNFMDGIDGIASVEAITIAVPGAALAAWARPDSPWPLALLFSASVAGFLIWNFPTARIFMGDAGSGFLGLVVATLGLAIGRVAPQLFWAWFILGGCFMVDATTTLVRRWSRGEKVYEAHRCHAYQYASRRHRSHVRVTIAVGAINLAWLLPWAALVAVGKADWVLAVCVSYAPLVWLAFRYKAGDRAAQEA
jgi:Fuc2NAc and GlcNAc transferase